MDHRIGGDVHPTNKDRELELPRTALPGRLQTVGFRARIVGNPHIQTGGGGYDRSSEDRPQNGRAETDRLRTFGSTLSPSR
jgi:hypothetical protein